MIGIEKVYIKGVSTLFVTNVEHKNKELPTLIYYHGFGSGKENNLTIAYLLAEKGYRVILPDCHYHGERHNNITNNDRQLAFWDIVIQSIKELDQIKLYLDAENLLIDNRIGVAGTSMGGMVTAGALVVYPWINLGGLLMSTGKLTSFAQGLISHYNDQNEQKISDDEANRVLTQLQQYDLYNHIDMLNDRPLFLWHGDDDVVVPPAHASQLVEKIEETNQAVGKVKFITEENRGHHLSRFAINEATNYISTYL